jgi:hypothetical protein
VQYLHTAALLNVRTVSCFAIMTLKPKIQEKLKAGKVKSCVETSPCPSMQVETALAARPCGNNTETWLVLLKWTYVCRCLETGLGSWCANATISTTMSGIKTQECQKVQGNNDDGQCNLTSGHPGRTCSTCDDQW